ncbi:hypothetical protein [Streptomyces sp. CMSTAAHL-2]|uniref:hypothetical protein n=1 Tax=Streptomyces sp. CMSTAAHL-2 TaxID=2904522 RepID=UPI001E53FE23|nr:hypothetical protein [Streptomyces sp. CMSTAAHL-2]MCE3030120.1 hypothetical protein [Streptomyces sp. CMSTAAHL-2]
MSNGSLAQRSWNSFIGRPQPSRVGAVGRARRGYTVGQRLWASFIGVDLPPASHRPRWAPKAPVYRPLLVKGQARVKWDSEAHDEVRGGGPFGPGRLDDGWFALPALGEAGGLTAAGGDAVLLEASSPDGGAAFLLRAEGGVTPEYRLEMVLRGGEAAGPLVARVRYVAASGGERTLLVPVVRGRFGPAASLIRLPGFTFGSWSARTPAPVTPAIAWDAVTVAASVRAALNEATRDAWRQVRELVGDELRATIDGELS